MENEKRPYLKTLHEYASQSTVHGIVYIFEKDRLYIERILWTIVAALSLAFAISLSVSAYFSWQENPILTTIATTALSVEHIPFPAITICGQGRQPKILDKASTTSASFHKIHFIQSRIKNINFLL